MQVTFWDFTSVIVLCMCVFSKHSAPRQFLTSETQHPEAAWPDGDDKYSNAGKNAITSKQMLKKHRFGVSFLHGFLKGTSVPGNGSLSMSSSGDRRINFLSFLPLKQENSISNLVCFLSFLLLFDYSPEYL